MIGGMGKAIAIKGGGAMTLQPGAMVRLNDIDNLRVIATNKGLILQTGNNGRRGMQLMWKGATKGAAKGAAKGATTVATTAKSGAAGAAQAKAMAASAKSMAASAQTLANAAAAPAKSVAVTAGAAKAVGAGTIWTGTGLSLGLGLGLGAMGPVLLLGAVAASAGGVYAYFRGRQGGEEPAY